MGLPGAIIGAGAIGAVGQFIGAQRTAQAQGRAAEAQLAEGRRTQALAMAAAEPSAEEIDRLKSAVKLNEQDIARRTALLESTDPAIIEAGRQALRLLQGQEASTLAPVKRARQETRLTLENQLRKQLGSGFETSSAGIQALARFDQETEALMAQEQDRSLGRLLGVAEKTTSEGLTNQVGQADSSALHWSSSRQPQIGRAHV